MAGLTPGAPAPAVRQEGAHAPRSLLSFLPLGGARRGRRPRAARRLLARRRALRRPRSLPYAARSRRRAARGGDARRARRPRHRGVGGRRHLPALPRRPDRGEPPSATVYERVYDAERPELFFKSSAWRVRGPDASRSRIRADSTLDVPEPELALVVNAARRDRRLHVCNDMSSRAIEGENPLYLPQAKMLRRRVRARPRHPARLGGRRPVRPGDRADDPPGRRGRLAGRDQHRPDAPPPRRPGRLPVPRRAPSRDGAVLSTGTGLVPELDFTLPPGDRVRIRVDGVGTLANDVLPALEIR